MADDVLGLLTQIRESAQEPPLSPVEKAVGYSRSFLAGPTFNFADNAEAAIASLWGPESYSQELQKVRSEQERFKRNTDYLDNVVEIASGGVLNPLNSFAKAAKGANYGLSTISTLFANPASQAAISAVGADNGQDPLRAGLIGGGVGLAGSVLANKLGGLLDDATLQADRLKTSAYGVTTADIGKELRKVSDITDFVDDIDQIPLVRTIEKYEKRGIIDAGQNALDNARSVHDLQNEISKKLTGVLSEVDSVVPGKADFQLSNTLKYIGTLTGTAKEEAGQIAGKEVDALAAQIGGGKLADLQQLKTGLNYMWGKAPTASDAIKANVIKALRSDLRQEIENRVDAAAIAGVVKPESQVPGLVKALNKEWGEGAALKDVMTKNIAKVYGGDVVDDVFRSIRTTEGGGVPMLASAVTGNPLYAAAGVLMNAARVPTMKSKIADTLREVDQIGSLGSGIIPGLTAKNIGKAIQEGGTARNFEQIYEASKGDKPYVSSVMPPEKPAATKEDVSSLMNEIRGLTKAKPLNEDIRSMFEDKAMSDEKPKAKNIADIEAKIDADPYYSALYEIESSRNPLATNKESSAKGGFQLIDSTAKALGVKDPLDLEQSFEGIKKLTEAHKQKFGDNPKMLYAAHYLGETTLRKAMKGEPLTDAEAAQIKFLVKKLWPRLEKIYATKVVRA